LHSVVGSTGLIASIKSDTGFAFSASIKFCSFDTNSCCSSDNALNAVLVASILS